MAKLSKEKVEEFRRLWKEEFDEEISYDFAEIRAGEILMLYEYLYTTTPQPK